MDPLFGSETRAHVLEQLALTSIPQSAYGVARGIGAEPIQVLHILKSLGEVVERTPAGWVLTDEQLRRFVRERWHRQAEDRRLEKDELLIRFGMKPSFRHGRRRLR